MTTGTRHSGRRRLSQDECQKLLKTLPQRWHSHVLLTLGAGVALTEVTRILPDDVDAATAMLIVRGRPGRRIPLHAEVLAMLQGRMAGGPAGTPLFKGWPNVGRQLPMACRKAGIPTVTPSGLRESFLGRMHEGGASESIARALVGRDSRMVRAVYGEAALADVSEAVRRLPNLIAEDDDEQP